MTEVPATATTAQPRGRGAATYRRAALAAAVAAVALAGTVLGAERLAVAQDMPRPAPELVGVGLEGEPLDLGELRGSVVLVPAWASWCSPCRDEVPVLHRALEGLGPSGLRVLGINVHDRPGNARAFAGPDGSPSYPSVLDEAGRHAATWGLRGVPETFLVDRDGQIVAHHLGAVTDDWVRHTVAPLVERSEVSG